jgi:4-amino-4-deoxy-L-arabinose transferase-like glycosyltransferase
VATGTAVTMNFEDARARLGTLAYPLALVATLSLWLLAVQAPLWLDETLAYWQISGGFSNIWSRSAQMPSSFAYLYILWLAKSLLGNKEVALRIPSMLAMLGAAYFLFRSARELLNEEIAYISCILFCIHLRVIFAANDARPYAFALLLTNLAIFAFILWISRHETRLAIQFGAAAAGILYFHYLFAVAILPAFLVCYLLVRGRSIRGDARQLAAVLLSFVVVSLPQVPRFVDLFRTRQMHVSGGTPEPLLVLGTLAPFKPLVAFVVVVFVAALFRKIRLPGRDGFPAGLLCLLFALIPAAILYGMSAATSLHMFHTRYWLVAVPGSALMWGWLISWIDSSLLRKTFCVGLVAVTLFLHFKSPITRKHETSFKQAHEFVNANVTHDKAPVLICNPFVESNFQHMPPAPESALFAQLSYYPVDAPVVFLPLALNDEATRVGSQYVMAAAQRHQRFLALVGPGSYPTVQWLAAYSSGTFAARTIGNFDGILVVEFLPLAGDT